MAVPFVSRHRQPFAIGAIGTIELSAAFAAAHPQSQSWQS
jgi:hypothetical protein